MTMLRGKQISLRPVRAADLDELYGRHIEIANRVPAKRSCNDLTGPDRTLGHAVRGTLDPENPVPGGTTMATLDTKDREKLRSNQFAYVDNDGGEHLPINDESHVRNAIARFNQTEFESKAAKERARKKILSAAKRHGIDVDEDSNVAKPTR
jgi:hypothetical protein